MERLLNKLLIEQTKRGHGTATDNGLVESKKNGAMVRKHMGSTHIAAPHEAPIQAFYKE
jgi:hypothetical protein